MPEIHLTRVAAIAPFPRFLAAGGSDVMRAMQSAGLAPELIATPETYIPLSRAGEFIEKIGRCEGIESFGQLVGAETSLDELGVYGRVISRSLSLHDAIRRAIRHTPEADTGARVWIERVNQRDTVRLCIRHEMQKGKTIADEYAMLLLLNVVRNAAGPDWRPQYVRLESDCTRARDQIEALADAQIECGADHAAFEIPGRLLQNRFNWSERADSDLDSEVQSIGPPSCIVERVKTAIQSGFGTYIPDVLEVSEMAGISIRGLQRQLGREGHRFRDLVNTARFREADRLLGEPDWTIAEIARHLGYPDPANFTHAFRGWTGVAPSGYRSSMDEAT